MPFDASYAATLPGSAPLPDYLSPGKPETVLGVSRALLEAEAMARVPAPLRDSVLEIELSEGGRFLHMGMVFDSVAWRARWCRPGIPAASGAIPVWNGRPA